MSLSANQLIEKIDNRPDYDSLGRVLDDWPSVEEAREEYVRFASDFLRDEGFEIEPAALRYVVGIFIALSREQQTSQLSG